MPADPFASLDLDVLSVILSLHDHELTHSDVHNFVRTSTALWRIRAHIWNRLTRLRYGTARELKTTIQIPALSPALKSDPRRMHLSTSRTSPI